MAPPFQKINRKVEDAIRNVILANRESILTTAVMPDDSIIRGAKGKLARTVPMIAIVCATAEAEIKADVITGNFDCEVSVSYISNYKDETRDERGERAGVVWDILMRPNLPAILNEMGNVIDFHAYNGKPGEGNGWRPLQWSTRTEENKIVEEVTGMLYCRPTT